jgi:hypothetical protein
VSDLLDTDDISKAKAKYTKGVLESIQKYKKENTREKEYIKRSCLSIIASKLINP